MLPPSTGPEAGTASDIRIQPPPDTPGRETALLRAMLDRIDRQDPGAFNNLGVLYHARGMHPEAVEAFLCALEIDPRMRTAARNLEVAAAIPGACDARISAIDARVEADPDDREALRARARLTRLIGHLTEAARQLDALLAEDPDDGVALFERGLIEQRAGDLRKAQKWYERAVNAGAATDAQLHLAEVLYQRGQNERALALLDELLRGSQRHAEAHLLRAFVLGDIGHHEEAIRAARCATEIDPALRTFENDLSIDTGMPGEHGTPMMAVELGGALAHYGLGLAFRQRGYLREARMEFDRALADGEQPDLVMHALAELDLLERDSDSARSRYEQLLYGEERPRWWNEHGLALHQAGSIALASESYRRALRLDPRYALAYNNLAVALADSGDQKAAREALLRATELDPTLARARRNLAWLFARNGEHLRAVSLLRELVTFHPHDADAWHSLGVILAELGRPDEAREALAMAIQQRPAHAGARFALAGVLGELGDHDGTVREIQQAMAVAPVRAPIRLTVGMDVQTECPDAAGAVDLLQTLGGAPLSGVEIGVTDLGGMLPEQPDALLSRVPTERVESICGDADAFAERTLHGEALERYQRAREMVGMERGTRAQWRRAALGEARSMCFLERASSARALLDELIAETPDDPEVLVLMAAGLADDPVATDSAVSALLGRVLAQHVGSAALLHFAGDVAARTGDRILTLGLYRQSLTCDPARPTPRVKIARLLRQQGDLLAARLEITAALTAAPGWRDALLELARVHWDSGRPGEARKILVESLERIPTDLEALDLLAGVLVAEDRYDDARVAVDRLLRQDPDRAAGLWYDGVLLLSQARLRDAIARWTRVERDPEAGVWGQRASKALERTRVRGVIANGTVSVRAAAHSSAFSPVAGYVA